jgi:hypothetical protein
MRFEVLMAVKMSILVFWVVMPCGLVGRYQHSGGTYCLCLQGITTQKTTLTLFYDNSQQSSGIVVCILEGSNTSEQFHYISHLLQFIVICGFQLLDRPTQQVQYILSFFLE